MIQHVWTVPCRFSLVDRESNNVSLIEVLEELTISALLPPEPGDRLLPAIFDVVTLWAREDDDQQVTGHGRMTLVSPSGEPLLVSEYEIDLRENRRFRSVGRVLGFLAQDSGRYLFTIERRLAGSEQWEKVASVPLGVTISRKENPPEPQASGNAQ